VYHARKLAKEYPEQYRYDYIQAAETLRVPYWDWASESFVPQATVPNTMQINIPSGEILQQVDVENPLATFKFPAAGLNGTFGNFDSQNRTQIYRCPPPQSYPDSANKNLASRPYKQWIVSLRFNGFPTSDRRSLTTPSTTLSLAQMASPSLLRLVPLVPV
jgi:tyrosinase